MHRFVKVIREKQFHYSKIICVNTILLSVAYLKLKILMRRLTEGGDYSKKNLVMNYFSSEDKKNKSTNYSQNKNLLAIFILIKQLKRFISFFYIRLRWVVEKVFFILQNHKLQTQNFTALKARLSFF